jgi:purine-binding chemotaxis protein CheW
MSDLQTPSDALVPREAELLSEEEGEARRRLFLFRACEEWFALPIEAVREVQPLERTTRVPNAPAEVRGILNLRGRAYTVFGLERCLGLPPGSQRDTHLVVLDLGDGDLRIGLAAQEIGQVRPIPVSAIGPAPPRETGQGGLAGVFELGGRVVGLLDLTRIFARFLGDWGLAQESRGGA